MTEQTATCAPHVTLPVVTTWDEWARVFTDVPTWAPAVHEIGRRAGLPVRTIEAGYPGTNAVFIVNAGLEQPYVVKIYCPFCREDLVLERVLHTVLAQVPDCRAPALLGQGVLHGEMAWPYLILSYIAGSAIRNARSSVPYNDLLAVARDLGRAVRRVHEIPRSALTELEPVLESWDVVALRHLNKTVEHLSSHKLLPSSVIAEIHDYVSPVLHAPASPDLVLVNGDLTEDHVLLQEHHGKWRISGLIDFADALLAPRDYEWVALWFGALNRDPACLRAFFDGYDPETGRDAGFHRRSMAFTFLHEFGGSTIETALKQLGYPTIHSLTGLQALLWPTLST